MILFMIILVLLLSTRGENSDADHCNQYCDEESGKCYGTSGNELEIPCGPDIFENYTYYNASQLLLYNSATVLTLVLSPYDHQTKITCIPDGDTVGPTYSYNISVCYGPQIIPVTENNGKGNHNQETSLVCPLQGNPSVTCSWDVQMCKDNQIIPDPYGIDYRDNGCTLRIAKLTANYTDSSKICFNCTARNVIGVQSQFFNSIDTFSCAQNPSELVMYANDTQPLFPNMALIVYIGDDLNLLCHVSGAGNINPLNYYRNITTITDPALQFHFFDYYLYSEPECLLIGILNITNLTYNDSGAYLCLYQPTDLFNNVNLSVTIQLSVTEQIEATAPTNTQSVYIISSIVVTALIVTIVSVFVGVFLVQLKIKRSSGAIIDPEDIPLDDDLFQTEYDVFLSFAEEDFVFAETKLKIPLEKSGYKICWHHDAFIPGYTVVENMERSIYKSRTTIVLLSNSFIMSEYCQRELAIASKKMERTSNSNCIMPVIMDKMCQLPSDIFKITHINLDDINFLEKVKKTLGNPVVTESDNQFDINKL